MNLKILIADDEQAARYAMSQTLSRSGYDIREANDGLAAVEAIVDQAPDLVFLDLAMPAAHSPEPTATAMVCLFKPMAALCFSTRSVTRRWPR